MKKFNVLVLIVGLALCFKVSAQSTDSLRANKERKNIIKFNVSSFFVYHTAVLFEYERIVNKNQSFTIQAGFVALAFLNTDSIQVVKYTKNTGYSMTADYRFYLLKENRGGPPHGVYIGPYVGYLHALNVIELTSGKSPNSLTTKIDVLSIGAEMGYQFLLGKRWTLDFVLAAPSLSNYRAQMDLALPVPTEDLAPIYQQALAALGNKFPLVNGLVNDQSTTFRGKLDAWYPGFRYSMHIGFRF